MATPFSPPAAVLPPATAGRRSSGTLRWIRSVHLYFGLFITPALLFFALTGALQTFNLHESAGEAYQPPAWIAHLAQIHKNQTSQLRPQRPGPRPGLPAAALVSPTADASRPSTAAHNGAQPPQTQPVPARPAAPVNLAAKARRHLPLKIFFLVVSLGLFSSSLTGIFMAYRFHRNKIAVTAILLMGVFIPLVLLRF